MFPYKAYEEVAPPKPPSPAEVIDYLDSRNGKPITITPLASRFKVSVATIRPMLETAMRDGTIQRVGMGYLIPQTKAPAGVIVAQFNTRPLKIDRRRAELYAELAASRAGLKSIG